MNGDPSLSTRLQLKTAEFDPKQQEKVSLPSVKDGIAKWEEA